MSMKDAANLLAKYRNWNEEQQQSKPEQDSAGRPNRLTGTWSYANPYDRFIDEISADKNFSGNMLQQSLQKGEVDTYLSLVKENLNKDLSNYFYDPGYQDYETQMLELYKGVADDVNLEERFTQVYDAEQNKWVEQSLGEMTDKSYIQYQLDQAYAVRTQELEAEKERQWREENKGAMVGHTIAAILSEFGEGIISALTGVLDFVAAPFAAFAGMAEGKSWGDAYVDYYAEQGLTAMERKTLRSSLDEYERKKTYMYDNNGNQTWVGKYLGSMSNSIGMMVPSIALNVVTGGTYGALSMGSFYASIYSSNLYDNATNPDTADSPAWLKIINAAVTSTAEAVIEVALGKILGSTIPNKLLGIPGGRFSTKAVSSIVKKGGGLKYLFKSAAQEGLEEFLQDFSTNCINQFYGMVYEGYEKTGVTFQTLVDSFIMGAATSLLLTPIHSLRFRGKRNGVAIEQKSGEVTVLKGLKAMALSDYMSEFKSAIDTLQKQKFGTKRNMRLAQDVYTAMNTMMQLYSSFTPERLKNAEALLARVTEVEQGKRSNYGPIQRFVSNSWFSTRSRDIRGNAFMPVDVTERSTRIRAFAEQITSDFENMVSTPVRNELKRRVKKANDAVSDILLANGVSEVKSITDKENTTTVNKGLSSEIIDNLRNELAKDYDFIFTVDGHIAIENENMLYVSEAWLENYTKSEIYEFLAQQRGINAILQDKQFDSFLDTLVKFDENFRKQRNMGREQALMDFLFNPSVFQAFILSDNGRNLHKHKDVIFRIDSTIARVINSNDISTEQKNYLKLIRKRIYETMRIPTLKAILNWNMDMQKYGASHILTENDRVFIKQYNARKALGSKIVNREVSSAFIEDSSELIKYGRFNAEEQALIEKGMSKNATLREKLDAVLLLDIAENTTYREKNAVFADYLSRAIKADNMTFSLITKRADSNVSSSKIDFDIALDFNNLLATLEFLNDELYIESVNTEQVKRDAKAYKKIYDAWYNSKNMDAVTFGKMFNIIVRIAKNAYRDSVNVNASVDANKHNSFIVPISSEALGEYSFSYEFDANIAQMKADAINTFEQRYGITPNALLAVNDLSEVSQINGAKFTAIVEDIDILNAESLSDFVSKKLEQLMNNSISVFIKGTNIYFMQFISPDTLFNDKLLTPMNRIDQNTALRFRFKTDDSAKSLAGYINEKSPFYQLLKDVKVVFYNDVSDGSAGYFSSAENTIAINISVSDNYFNTLVHETNHAIQSKLIANLGGNANTFLPITEYTEHIFKEHIIPIKYELRASGYGYLIERITEISNKKGRQATYREVINELPSYDAYFLAQCVAYVSYAALTGEVWARSGREQGIVKGYTFDSTGNSTVVVSPEGNKYSVYAKKNTDAPIQRSVSAKTSVPSYTDADIQQSYIDTLSNIIPISDTASSLVESGKTSGTYHSRLTRAVAEDILSDIIKPEINGIEATNLTLDDIIRNPAQYVRESILAEIGQLHEGNVYNKLRDYVERNYKGISIDRTANTHEYILVDNDVFNDLYNTRIAKYEDDGTHNNLVSELSSENGIELSRIYKSNLLNKQGANPELPVVINSKVNNEFVVNDKYPRGAIFIRADENTSNAELLNKINHEFRHYLQELNQLEGGFTTQFKVTDEMIADFYKHIPEVMQNEELRELMRVRYGDRIKSQRDLDAYMIRQFVYRLNNGEIMANAYLASMLSAKPTYAYREAGRAHIFMPWYDATTGEGRYETDILANVLDENGNKVSSPLVTPIQEKIDAAEKLDRRFFTKELAKGTNLEFFYKERSRNEMDPRLQRFVIATTGKLDDINPVIANAIKRGKLTYQGLMKYLRDTEASSINDTTFNLLNRTIWRNNNFRSMKEVDDFIQGGGTDTIRYMWAICNVLYKDRLIDFKSILETLSIDEFLKFINTVQYSEYKEKINKVASSNFDMYLINGKLEYIAPNDETLKTRRISVLENFDGTIASAYYIANTLRKIVKYYQDYDKKAISGDASFSEENESTIFDTIASGGYDESGEYITYNQYENVSNDDEADMTAARDILALYEKDTYRLDRQDMIVRLMDQREHQLDMWAASIVFGEKSPFVKADIEEKRLIYEVIRKGKDAPHLNISDEYYRVALKSNIGYERELNKYYTLLQNSSDEDIARRYEPIAIAELADKQNRVQLDSNITASERERAQVRIKSLATQLINLAVKGKIVWENLPESVRDMFYVTDRKDKNMPKGKAFALKPEVYQVGKGAVKGKGNVVHDTTQLLRNKRLLQNAVTDAKNNLFVSKELATARSKAERDLQNYLRKEQRRLRRESVSVSTDEVFETDITVSNKKRRTEKTDTPNNFTIVSKREMPSVFKDILDVSFSDFRDTLVKFASVDENGNLYIGDKNNKKFKSRLQHEVTSWRHFYDVNRNKLLALTRDDVLDIVDFIQGSTYTLDGPTDKLVAFELFTLGYVIDAASQNISNWNFSTAEIEQMRALYEKMAGTFGSGLNAVGQMQSVVNPLKYIQSRMFEQYGISEQETQPVIDAVNRLQEARGQQEITDRAAELGRELQILEERIIENDVRPKFREAGYGSHLYNKIKSFRFTAMLSSPATWVRNIVSNVMQYNMTKTADVIGQFIWSNKYHKENQWDLSSRTVVSEEVRNFIDNNVKNSELFQLLYDGSTKYNEFTNTGNTQRELFANMLLNALQSKYAAEHRFDSKIMNNVANFVQRMISDKNVIKRAANRYFGKILTIESNAGRVSLDEGLSDTVLNLFAESVILANEDFMHKRNALSDTIDSIRDKHRGLYEVLHFIQPFINSSFNWFAEGLKYTPFGLVKSIWDAHKFEKQIDKLDRARAEGKTVPSSRLTEFIIRRNIGKGIVGTVFTVLGIMLASFGVVRIEDDDDKYYLYVGDIRVDITRIFGSSSILLGAALISTAMKADTGKTASEIIQEGFIDVFNILGEGFFLKDMWEGIQYDNSFWDVMLGQTESVLKSFVPQFWQLIIRVTSNKKLKYSPGILGMFERYINSFTPTMPLGDVVINPYTGEVQSKWSIPVLGGLLQSGILGANIYLYTPSKIEEFMNDMGKNKGQIKNTLNVNDKEYEFDAAKLNSKYGELNAQAFTGIEKKRYKVKMPNGTYRELKYAEMSDEQKVNIIERIMNENSTLAKVWYWTDVLGHKYYADSATYQTLRAAGIVKNVFAGTKGFVE